MIMNIHTHFLRILWGGLFFIIAQNASAENTVIDFEIKVANGNSISINRPNPGGSTALLWISSEHGLTRADKKVAGQLAKHNIDVWLVDLLNSYFLAPVASSIKKIPVQDISLVTKQFLAGKKKKKIIMASGLTAGLLLQALKSDNKPAGVILISPNLYIATPEPGNDATYLPITSRTKQNIKILQPQLSPWFWQADNLKKLLESGGSKVSVKTLSGVRDRFYFRPDASANEKDMQGKFPKVLSDIIKTFK